MFAGSRVVLGVTGGIAAYKAVEVCRRLVDAGAHVQPVLTRMDDDIHRLRDSEQRAALRRVDDLVAPLGTAAGRLRRSVEHGDPAHLILGKEKQLESDLIIIGKKGESALHDLLLGSVTRHVLSASQTDVMVVGEDMIEPRRESASEPPSASLSTEE